MKALALAFVALFLCLPGCTPAADPATIRADARATVSLLGDAWVASKDACVGLAVAMQSQDVLDKCKAALVPAGQAIEAAGAAVDSWQDADQKDYTCLVADAAAGLLAVEKLVGDAGVQLPPLVDDALRLAAQYGSQCVRPADGGAG